MKWGVIRFPGSLDDLDAMYGLRDVMGQDVMALWHKDESLRGAECVVLPGGFSYGDHLRCGAIARFSPIMKSVAKFAADGGLVIGICNGFQILTEAHLLPGALTRNRTLSFICERVHLRVENAKTPFTCTMREGDILALPIKHGEGCYVAPGKGTSPDGGARAGHPALRRCEGGRPPTRRIPTARCDRSRASPTIASTCSA